MVRSVREHGWADASFGTFDVSLIVLAACFAGVFLVSQDKRSDNVSSLDIAAYAVFVALLIPPITSLSWLAVAVLSLYILLLTEAGEQSRRGARILLATTIPMLLIPWLFGIFSKFILGIDGLLAGWLLRTDRNGIFVEFADNSATMMVFPGCSSLPNMGLAFLCWVVLSQSVGHRWRPHDIFWCGLAVASAAAVNVIRITLMGVSLSYYAAIHSPMGDTVVNIILLSLSIGICMLGVRRELFSRI